MGMPDLHTRINARQMPRTRAEQAQRTLTRLLDCAPEAFNLSGEIESVEDSLWKAAYQAAKTQLDSALQDFGVQERCPAWWVLGTHLNFSPTLRRTFEELRRDRVTHFHDLSPVIGVAPLAAVAAYSRRRTLTYRALPAQASGGTPGTFITLREVGMIRYSRFGGAYHILSFTDPSRPYSG